MHDDAPLHISKKSRFGKTERLGPRDNQMIEHPNIDQRQRLTQPARDEFIGLTGFGHSRRVLGFISGCHRYLCPSVPSPTVTHT